jgi:hypothetical protein
VGSQTGTPKHGTPSSADIRTHSEKPALSAARGSAVLRSSSARSDERSVRAFCARTGRSFVMAPELEDETAAGVGYVSARSGFGGTGCSWISAGDGPTRVATAASLSTSKLR